MIKALIKITAFTLAIAAIQQVVVLSGLPIPIAEEFYPILIFFSLQSIALHFLFLYSQAKSGLLAPHIMILVLTTLRLLTTLAGATLFITLATRDTSSFVITFFVLYLFYLIFEILMALPSLRSNLK